MNLFENLQMMKEADELDKKNIDFRRIDTKEFADMVGTDSSTIIKLLKDCQSCSYVNKPYEAIVRNVELSKKISEDKIELVSEFIYANLFNRVLGDVHYKYRR